MNARWQRRTDRLRHRVVHLPLLRRRLRLLLLEKTRPPLPLAAAPPILKRGRSLPTASDRNSARAASGTMGTHKSSPRCVSERSHCTNALPSAPLLSSHHLSARAAGATTKDARPNALDRNTARGATGTTAPVDAAISATWTSARGLPKSSPPENGRRSRSATKPAPQAQAGAGSRRNLGRRRADQRVAARPDGSASLRRASLPRARRRSAAG